MRLILGVALFVASLFLSQAQAGPPPPPPPPPSLSDFLSDVDFWSPELSPSGRYLSGVRRIEGEDYLIIIDLDNPEANPTFKGLGDFYVSWIDWVSEDRMLIALRGYVNIQNGRQMTRQEIQNYNGSNRVTPVRFSRLISMERTTGKVAAMFGDSRSMNQNFSLGRVTDFLPDDPDHILMPARKSGDLDLFKVNVVDGSFERIATGTDNTYAWYTDRNGEPAFRLNTNSRGTLIYVFAREDRENGKIKWRKTRTIRLKDKERNSSALDFQILYPGPTSTTYYISARPDGQDFAGIYLYDFEKDEIVETVRLHDALDIESGFFNANTRELMGVYYYDDRLVIEMDDQNIENHLRGLNAYFGDEANVVPMDTNREGNRWLLYASGPREPGSYHVYDLDTARAIEISAQKLSLVGKTLGQAQIIEYTARDGLKLRGYLTRPANVAEGTTPPLVVMPHGGPEVRDYMDYDTDVQILVAQGYQVFQPNFRGSSGYGRNFADLGRKQWGKAMQTDIDDGFDHLVAEGLADPDRACIFGFSYGGYAAMAAATLTPEKYTCAIAAAGVSDLRAFLKRERKEEGGDSEAYQYWLDHIGHPDNDRDALYAVSPAALANRVSRPLLILHGKEDGVVDYEQAEIMEKALKNAGKPYRLVTLKDSGHSYMSEEDEATYYAEIISFLNTHLPVD